MLAEAEAEAGTEKTSLKCCQNQNLSLISFKNVEIT